MPTTLVTSQPINFNLLHINIDYFILLALTNNRETLKILKRSKSILV